MPILYFLYPETCELLPTSSSKQLLIEFTLANRQLEDIDAYYRTNPPIIVTRDKDAICAKRPLKYAEHEEHTIRQRRASIAGSVMEVGESEKHA